MGVGNLSRNGKPPRSDLVPLLPSGVVFALLVKGIVELDRCTKTLQK